MLKINSIVYGLLIPFCSFASTTAATIDANPNKDSNLFLLSQLTPTGRQQDAFARDSHTLYRQIQEGEELKRRQLAKDKQIRSIASALTSKRDYVGLGNLYYSNGYMQEAIAAYSKAIEVNPKNSGGYFGRARAKRNQSDLQGAITDYGAVIALNPKSDGAYTNRALAKYKLGDKNGSLQDFRSAVRIYREIGKMEELKDTLDRIQYFFKVPE